MHQFKYFHKDAKSAGSFSWRWPFLDVIFYDENETHIWNHELEDINYFQKDKFYPLIQRPFSKIKMLAPYDTGYFLRQKFVQFKCQTGAWNHPHEKRYSWLFRRYYKVDCARLYEVYPQVWEEKTQNGTTLEVLKLGDKVVNKVQVKGGRIPDEPSGRPYDL